MVIIERFPSEIPKIIPTPRGKTNKSRVCLKDGITKSMTAVPRDTELDVPQFPVSILPIYMKNCSISGLVDSRTHQFSEGKIAKTGSGGLNLDSRNEITNARKKSATPNEKLYMRLR
ncbi:MAG: hypothetical protein ACFE8E_12890 [Candidatus Hodarchaeota archaeon]